MRTSTPHVGAPERNPAGAEREARLRQLEVVREIAHAFLTSTRPVEVYRLALARVIPIVHADFGSVVLRDPGDETLLKLECAHNWPQSAALFLGQLRFRVGRGPTGRSVAERCAVEVEDVFADPLLREWREPAGELGFRSLMALPLVVDGRAQGALTFYFAEAHRFDEEERRLLVLIADQLAVTAARMA